MEQKRQLRLLEKIAETDDTVTFRLEAVDGRPFVYQPGQYLTLIFPEQGREKRRAYSFSSSPATDAYPAITVKRVPNGEFSNRLLYRTRPGDVFTTTEANGHFLLPPRLPETLFYLAAGSGITPIMSHLKTLLTSSPLAGQPRILLFYANRDSRSTAFKAQLDHWMAAYPGRFECVYFFSREKQAEHARFRHLNNELLEQELRRSFGGQLTNRHRSATQFFLCAPPAMMRMARMTLRQLGVPEENLHFEAFTPVIVPAKRPVDSTHAHRVIAHWPGERIEFHVFNGETILDGALRQGIALPYSCKAGVCLSCLARCVHGEIEVEFAQTTQYGKPGDLVNTCLGYAASDTVEIAYD